MSATAGGGEAGRPSVLSLNIKDKSALYAAYIGQLKHGGLFIPTNRVSRLGDEVFMLVALLGEAAKLPVAGKVVWITPEGAHGNKAQGIGVQFSADESGQSARRKIESALGSSLLSTKITDTI